MDHSVEFTFQCKDKAFIRHLINSYKANLKGKYELKCSGVLANGAVGAFLRGCYKYKLILKADDVLTIFQAGIVTQKVEHDMERAIAAGQRKAA